MPTNDLEDQIRMRLEALAEWLQAEDQALLSEQRHLAAGSTERLYWHFGYFVALNDLLQERVAQADQSRNKGTASWTAAVAPDGRSYH